MPRSDRPVAGSPRGWQRVRAAAALGALAVFLAAPLARAADTASAPSPSAPHAEEAAASTRDARRLSWAPHARFRPVQYAVTLGAPVLFRIIDRNTTEAAEPRWRGPVLFDAGARDLLRASSAEGQRTALLISDYAWYSAMAWPFADALIVALALDQNPEVAWQLSALALQAYALSGFVTLLAIKAVARERPSELGCSDGSPDPACARPPRGFPSGHTAGTFAGAGLVCASHGHLPLYGGPTADRAACLGALTLAGTAAVMRLRADRHYASDVLVGAGVGVAVGYALPTLFQYSASDSSDRLLSLSPGRAGSYLLTYGGSF